MGEGGLMHRHGGEKARPWHTGRVACHIIGAGLVPDGRAGGPSKIKVILKACGRQDQLELGDRS